MTDQEAEVSGVENKLLGRQNLGQNLVLFAGKKPWRREIVAKFPSGATMLIDLWSKDLLRVRKQQNLKGNERSIYSTLQVSNTAYLVQFNNSRLLS